MPPQDDVIKQLKRYYLFHGPNNYKLDERVSSLIKAAVAPGSEAFDLDRFGSDNCEISDVINAASTPPVISPLRIVILADVERLSSSAQSRLEAFLSKIPEYSVLAMTAAKIDKRSKMFKKLAAEDKVYSYFYDVYKPDEAVGLAIKFASDRNKKMTPLTASALVDIFGTDPYRLQTEIEKTALFVGEKTEIEKKDLAFASGLTHVETAYDLPGLILAGKSREALELVQNAISSGISEMQMLYILKYYLVGLNAAIRAGNVKALLSMMRMMPERARDLIAASRGISQHDIAKGLSYIFRAEYALKSARFPSEMVMELLVSALHLTFKGNIPRDKMYLL